MDDLNELPDVIRRGLERLDDRAEARARHVDAARVAERVVERLRSVPAEMPRPQRRWQWAVRPLALAAAAAVVLLAGGALLRQRLAGRDATAALPVGILAESTLASHATAVAGAVDSLLVVNGSELTTSIVTVEDLTAAELETLLDELGSSESSEEL